MCCSAQDAHVYINYVLCSNVFYLTYFLVLRAERAWSRRATACSTLTLCVCRYRILAKYAIRHMKHEVWDLTRTIQVSGITHIQAVKIIYTIQFVKLIEDMSPEVDGRLRWFQRWGPFVFRMFALVDQSLKTQNSASGVAHQTEATHDDDVSRRCWCREILRAKFYSSFVSNVSPSRSKAAPGLGARRYALIMLFQTRMCPACAENGFAPSKLSRVSYPSTSRYAQSATYSHPPFPGM